MWKLKVARARAIRKKQQQKRLQEEQQQKQLKKSYPKSGATPIGHHISSDSEDVSDQLSPPLQFSNALVLF